MYRLTLILKFNKFKNCSTLPLIVEYETENNINLIQEIITPKKTGKIKMIGWQTG